MEKKNKRKREEENQIGGNDKNRDGKGERLWTVAVVRNENLLTESLQGLIQLSKNRKGGTVSRRKSQQNEGEGVLSRLNGTKKLTRQQNHTMERRLQKVVGPTIRNMGDERREKDN